MLGIIPLSRKHLLNSAVKFTKYNNVVHQRTYLRTSTMFPRIAFVKDLNKKSSSEKITSKSYILMQATNILRDGDGAKGTFLHTPLLTRSLEKLHQVIDREMHGIGAQKIAMPNLATKEDWDQSGRWNVMGAELLKLKDRSGHDLCLAPTHEEVVTKYVADHPVSLMSLPIMLYQIGRKFRDEMRPKHGLLRCREFEMKDLYSFDQDLEHAKASYEQVCEAYSRIFNRLGLNFVRVGASSGAMGGSTSHEFHLVSDVGEDKLYKCKACGSLYNRELLFEELKPDNTKTLCKNSSKPCSEFDTISGIEVAHAFILGTKYSEAFNARYESENKKYELLHMGCFGIGVTRMLAASIEVLSHKAQIQWPSVIAPYQIFVIPGYGGEHNEKMISTAEHLCTQFERFSHLQREVVLSDKVKVKKQAISTRIKAAKQIGVPHIVVVGEGSMDKNPMKFEYIDVYNDKTSYLTEQELMGLFSSLDTAVLEF